MDTITRTVWRGIVDKGNFKIVASPYGLHINFFDQCFMIHRRANGKYPKIGLFAYPEKLGLYRARLQVTCFDGYAFINCDMVVNLFGIAHPSYRAECEVDIGEPLTVNPNYNEEKFRANSDQWDEWR